MKKDGGVITNWQLHTLGSEYLVKYPGTLGRILTGTVKHDPTGRWEPGFHMRSSMVVSFDGETVETLNTLYKVDGPEGEKVLPTGDLGTAVLNIFY